MVSPGFTSRVWPPDQDREGAEVHRHDGLDPQQLNRLGGPGRAHGVEVADRQERNVEPAQLGYERHVAEHVGVTREVDREAVLELDDQAACLAAVDHPAVVRDPTRVLRMDEQHLDAVDVHGAALVGGDDLFPVDALRAEPGADLMVGDYRRLGVARDLEAVVDVVEMTMRDEHQVAPIDGLQVLRSHRVVHDPGVDQDLLASGAASFPGSVTNPGEADFGVERHSLTTPLVPSGKGDFPTRPIRISRSPRWSTCSERTGRMAAAGSQAGRCP